MKRLIVIFVFLFFYSENCISQNYPLIDSIEVLPNFPTDNDSIKVHFKLLFSEDYSKLLTTWSSSDDTIVITTCYIFTGLQRPMFVKDSVIIGKLSKGYYQIRIEVYRSNDPVRCSYNFMNSNMSEFFVSASGVSVSEIFGSNGFKAYPNPASTAINVTLMTAFDAPCLIKLQDITGRIVAEWSVFGKEQEDTNIKLEIQNIPHGIYLLTAEQAGHTVFKGKHSIIKN